jgi:hypothetical protein
MAGLLAPLLLLYIGVYATGFIEMLDELQFGRPFAMVMVFGTFAFGALVYYTLMDYTVQLVKR